MSYQATLEGSKTKIWHKKKYIFRESLYDPNRGFQLDLGSKKFLQILGPFLLVWLIRIFFKMVKFDHVLCIWGICPFWISPLCERRKGEGGGKDFSCNCLNKYCYIIYYLLYYNFSYQSIPNRHKTQHYLKYKLVCHYPILSLVNVWYKEVLLMKSNKNLPIKIIFIIILNPCTQKSKTYLTKILS